MHKRSFVDETFDLNMTSHYDLSIQLSLDGFSFLVFDTARNKFIAYLECPIDSTTPDDGAKTLKAFLNAEPKLKQAYRRVRLINNTERYTVIPEAFYQKQQVKSFFNLNHPLADIEELHSTKFAIYNFYVTHAISSVITNIIRQYYVKFQVLHQTLPFVKRLEVAHPENNYLAVNINPHHIDIIQMEGGNHKVKLLKSYPYQTASDIIYWLLAVNNTNNAQQLPIYLSGISPSADFNTQLKKHFTQTKWLTEQSNEYTLSYQFHQMPKGAIANHLNLTHCEL